VIAPRALGVVESTVVDDEKTVTFATSGAVIQPLLNAVSNVLLDTCPNVS